MSGADRSSKMEASVGEFDFLNVDNEIMILTESLSSKLCVGCSLTKDISGVCKNCDSGFCSLFNKCMSHVN